MDRFITITGGAFISVMMSWFGVNYLLATGLHPYGFSEGGGHFLGAFFLDSDYNCASINNIQLSNI